MQIPCPIYKLAQRGCGYVGGLKDKAEPVGVLGDGEYGGYGAQR